MSDNLIKTIVENLTSSEVFPKRGLDNVTKGATNNSNVDESLLRKLSNAFKPCTLTPSMVDKSGKDWKILLRAHVNVCLESVRKGGRPPMSEYLDRPICTAIGVKREVRLKIVNGDCEPYHEPLSKNILINNTSDWVKHNLTTATWGSSYTRTTTNTQNHYYTAAALQLAVYYCKAVIRKHLGIMTNKFDLASTDVSKVEKPYSSMVSCVISKELGENYTGSVLNLLYHTLVSKDVFEKVHIVNRGVIINEAGKLPLSTINESDFWQVYDLIKQNVGSKEDQRRFEFEFLVGVMHNHPLHSNCDEGGIFRSLFYDISVRSNSGLIIKPDNLGSPSRVESDTVLSAVICLQSLVSRTLYETSLHDAHFMLGHDVTNSDAEAVMCGILPELCNMMSIACELSRDYLFTFLGQQKLSTRPNKDRHLVQENCVFLKHFSPFICTYAVFDDNSKIGHYECNNDKTFFLELFGQGGIEELCNIEGNNIVHDFTAAHSPMQGLFFLRAGINRNPGKNMITYDHTILPDQKHTLIELPLIDGYSLYQGDRIDAMLWRDNGCIIPCSGDFRTIFAGTHICKHEYMKKVFYDYTYSVHITKYSYVSLDDYDINAAANQHMSMLDLIRAKEYGKVRSYNRTCEEESRHVNLAHLIYSDGEKERERMRTAIINEKLDLTNRLDYKLHNTYFVSDSHLAANCVTHDDIKWRIKTVDAYNKSLITDDLMHCVKAVVSVHMVTSDKAYVYNVGKALVDLKANCHANEFCFGIITKNNHIAALNRFNASGSGRIIGNTKEGYSSADKPGFYLPYGSSKKERYLDFSTYMLELDAVLVPSLAAICRDSNEILLQCLGERNMDLDTFKISLTGSETHPYTTTKQFSKAVMCKSHLALMSICDYEDDDMVEPTGQGTIRYLGKPIYGGPSELARQIVWIRRNIRDSTNVWGALAEINDERNKHRLDIISDELVSAKVAFDGYKYSNTLVALFNDEEVTRITDGCFARLIALGF